MRRISARYAKPSMLLSRALCDSYGRVILREGTALSAHQVSNLQDLGVGELFVKDKRAEDLVLFPLVTPELEGLLAAAVRGLLQKTQSLISHGKAQSLDLSPVRQGVRQMVHELFPAAMGDPVVSGCHSVKDYDYVHPVKVASLSLLLGKAAGLAHADLESLGVAALLQNVGYAAMSQGFVEKPGPLSTAEIQVVQRHPAMGAEILRRYSDASAETVMAVQQHHERWNGSGYPEGLAGLDICVSGRVLSIADCAVALVSRRPHRGRILAEDDREYVSAFSGDPKQSCYLKPSLAKEFVVAYSGELFDPGLVRMFARQIPTYPKGVMVRLSTGEAGIVSDTHGEYGIRPRVRLCLDKELRDMEQPVEIDLSETGRAATIVTEVMEY